MESSIAQAKDEKHSELIESGASQNEIDKELIYVEKKIKLINQWEKSQFEDFVAATMFASILGFLAGGFIFAFFVRKVFRKTQLVLIFFASLTPALWQAFLFGTDARGLTILSSIESKDFSFNPYAKDGGFISPTMASWLFINHPELYNECGMLSEKLDQCDMPIIFYIGNTLEFGSSEVTERQYSLLEAAISDGASLTEDYDGLAPIHQAILFNNPRYTKLLLDSGADIGQRINRPDKSYNGYDAVEYLNYLDQKGKQDFNQLKLVINEKLNKRVN
ncbi:hypothetical protein GCM10007418_00010 [Halopseudomonas salina]|uniref:Ankyrin repeat domain-containing protein n=2 Tax=Halopseudomonas salina TaxID=1323744 RepID=A0ABQ1P016_9GAMM|nr:hypothetical protein GCM10007418_00010 [Halopseudomonas salina]